MLLYINGTRPVLVQGSATSGELEDRLTYKSNPKSDPKYVPALRETLRSRFSGQNQLDTVMRDLYIQKHRIEGQAPSSPDVKFRPVGTGFVGLLVDQDVSILGGNWTARVAAIDPADERHVSGKLEPVIFQSFKRMQKYNEVWRPMVKDSRIYGRFAGLGPIPSPMYWGTGNEDLKRLFTLLEDAEDDDKDGYRREIAGYYQGNFPVVWQRWNPPDVYLTRNDRHLPSEVVYDRKMYAQEIVDNWGDDALPDRKRSVGPVTLGRKGYRDDEQIDVIDYVNGKFYAVVIPDKDDTRVAHQWEHKMGCTPVTFGETGRLPENQNGWVWAGAAIHIRESIHALDDAYTDWRTHIRQSPRTPLVAKLNAEARSQLDGWPSQITVTGAENEVVNLLIDEGFERGPIPGINADLPGFVDRFTAIVSLLGVRRDALMGSGPSGQSAVHLNVAQTLEKGELAEAKTGLERGLEWAVQLLFKSFVTLANEYPEAPTEIPIGKNLKIKANDVKGYEDLVQVKIDLNLPVNEGLAVQAYAQATASRGLDPYSARERFLNVANPAEIDDKWLEYELFQIAADVVKTIVGSRVAGGLEAINNSPALLKKMTSLSQFALEGIASAYGENGGTPSVGRQMGNVGRTGAGQDMSQLQGAQTVLP